MAEIKYVTLNSSFIDPNINYYIYNPINPNSNFTYILPNLIEGMVFKFVRNDLDSSSNLTISANSADTFANSTNLTFTNLKNNSNIIIVAKNGQWFIVERSYNTQISYGSIASSYFIASNDGPVVYNSGINLVCNFYYNGSDITPLKNVYFVLSSNNINSLYILYLSLPNGTAISSTSLINPPIANNLFFYKIDTIVTSLLPSNSGWLSIFCNSNAAIQIHSMVVR